ncbi:hypothetical protein [Pusillimonas noertemannii]|uniref:Uncharacterized protein n=1 Tax=Pusillimonas noertemannii TaxID=305977 RepID=A0A2U1CRY4_9BURK|nr:hypothetical protein [Pusillimonas noertemannii]NYT67981.1 hypothetical protein [Pusillimonas noertemannii]PVY68658.1 hypothetical protein C7440_1069 [Pusillimonas noertemannii]TFL11878.1 hypothetical protein CSC72_01745 [Pusillimonas noertemannii]
MNTATHTVTKGPAIPPDMLEDVQPISQKKADNSSVKKAKAMRDAQAQAQAVNRPRLAIEIMMGVVAGNLKTLHREMIDEMGTSKEPELLSDVLHLIEISESMLGSLMAGKPANYDDFEGEILPIGALMRVASRFYGKRDDYFSRAICGIEQVIDVALEVVEAESRRAEA